MNEIYKRENYLRKIRGFYHITDIIKVIIGIKESGKSCILMSIIEELIASGIKNANNIGGIPAPLLDRLEIIELSSYTIYEKLNIAKYHLIPDLLNEYKVKNIKFTDSAIQKIITYLLTKSKMLKVLKK